MPYYVYNCPCGTKPEEFRSIGKRDDPVLCSGCGVTSSLSRTVTAPGFTSSESLGRIKAPAEFRNLLSAIKKANPGSNINER